MRQDDRAVWDSALERARSAAYPPGEFVGQESFMSAGEIRAIAVEACIGRGTTVLDLCCGVAGPGRLIARETHCRYLGVDASAGAVDLARARAREPAGRFEVARIPPLPSGPFDVVLLLETLLAFPDKESLLREVSAALPPGGRFACTLEAGSPLTPGERERMPEAETVWPVPLPELLAAAAAAGLALRWCAEWTPAHQARATALLAEFTSDAPAIAARLGRRAVEDLLAAHRLWSDWLRSGRVRKYGLVLEKEYS